MTEMRVKVKKRKEVLSEKKKQKDLLSQCLELIKYNNQKLTDLSMNFKKLGIIRTRIKDTKKKSLQFELQLRALQIEDLKWKRNLYESNEDDIEVFKSHHYQEAIKNLKKHFKGSRFIYFTY